MNPEDRCMRVMTNQSAAPTELLDVVSCGCKNNCTSKQCTCKEYGLPCTQACKGCHGTTCDNAHLPDFSDDTDDYFQYAHWNVVSV